MTLQECTTVLAPLAVTLRSEVDGPTFRAYHRALADLPPLLLVAAVDRAARAATFFPKPSELREYAEAARLAILQAHPFDPCAGCCGGWIEQEVAGVSRAQRCPCWKAWQAKLAQIGAGPASLVVSEPRQITGEAWE